MSYHALLVDGNHTAWISFHAMKLSANGKQTQAVYGVLKSMIELRTAHSGARIQVLWDGRAQKRFDLCPEYKSNREDTPDKAIAKDSFIQQKPWITAMLSSLGIPQIHYRDLEADDLAGFYAGKARKNPKLKLLLVSGDEDWLQLVTDNVHWYDPVKDIIVTPKNFCDHTGYTTRHAFLQGKCLQGDTSDAIKGVGGLGEKRAAEFIATHGSVTAFWKKCDDGSYVPKLAREKNLYSMQGRAAFKRNLALMQLLVVPLPKPEQKVTYPCAFDRAAFDAICTELAFVSIKAKMAQIERLFGTKLEEAA